MEKKKDVFYVMSEKTGVNDHAVIFMAGENLNAIRYKILVTDPAAGIVHNDYHLSIVPAADIIRFNHIPVVFCAPAPAGYEPEKPGKDPNGKKWFNKNNIHKFARAIVHYRALWKHGIHFHATISQGNDKIGKVKNFSTLPFFTCSGLCKGSCAGDCYAAKMASIYGSALNAWAKNTFLAVEHLIKLFTDINKAITKRVKFFRFHVSGDILSEKYLLLMINTIKAKSWCRFWSYTKQFAIVNKHGPEVLTLNNFSMLFSGGWGIKIDNPYNFPTTTVFDKKTPAPRGAYICKGDCQYCIDHGTGCVTAGPGDVVAFGLH